MIHLRLVRLQLLQVTTIFTMLSSCAPAPTPIYNGQTAAEFVSTCAWTLVKEPVKIPLYPSGSGNGLGMKYLHVELHLYQDFTFTLTQWLMSEDRPANENERGKWEIRTYRGEQGDRYWFVNLTPENKSISVFSNSIYINDGGDNSYQLSIINGEKKQLQFKQQEVGFLSTLLLERGPKYYNLEARSFLQEFNFGKPEAQFVSPLGKSFSYRPGKGVTY